MYKYLITAIIIALFAGCSAPRPKTAPSWYTTVPKDFNFIYATASSSDDLKAKKQAVAKLRSQINEELDNAFVKKTTKLVIESSQDITPILKANEYVANTLSMRAVIIAKKALFQGEHLVLVKLSRKTLFNALSRRLNKKLPLNIKAFKNTQGQIAIKRYIVISELMKNYVKFASLIQAKQVALASYSTYDEFAYLSELSNAYKKLKKNITISVLSDVNSREFTPAVKNAFRANGLLLSSQANSKDAVKLLITSKTEQTQNYSFNQSKSLVKFTTYDINKKQIAFKQHTFIGKSRKNFKEAKQQSAIHLKNKIRTVGIFHFLGLKK